MSRQIFTLAIVLLIGFISFISSRNELQLDPDRFSFHTTNSLISITADAPPSKYSLEQNYPQSFNPETAIYFSYKDVDFYEPEISFHSQNKIFYLIRR